MKSLPLIVALLLATFTIYAQNVNIEWGAANKNESFVNRILGETENDLITLASKNENFFIETYDKKTLNIKKSAPFSLPQEMGKKTKIEEIHFFPKTDKIILFTSVYSDKTNNVYYYELSENGEIDKGSLLLSIDVERKGRKGRFGFRVSDDDNTILVYHTSKLKKEKAKQVRVKVINAEVQLVADMNDKIPMKDDKFELFVNDFTFDQNGYIHMLVTKPNPKYKDFFFYTYDINNNYAKKTYKIELDKDHVINTIAFTINADNHLVAAGYYSDFAGAFRGLTIQGIFSFVYNPEENNVVYKKLSAFKPSDYVNAYGDKYAKRFKKGLPLRYYMREIIIKNDGSIALVSEYYYESESSSAGPVSTKTYMYGDILVSDLDINGNISWLQSIPKAQIFIRPSLNFSVGASAGNIFANLSFSIALMKDKSVFLSYLLCVQNDKIYFIYNDNPKNIDVPINEKVKPMRSLNKGIPTLVSMDSKGRIKREPLPGAKNDELILRPRINKRVSNNIIYVYGNKRKLDKVGRLIFK